MTTEERRSEWATAVAVVGTGALVGYALLGVLGFPKAGIVLGVASGMSVNWIRGCPVCHEHVERMRGENP